MGGGKHNNRMELNFPRLSGKHVVEEIVPPHPFSDSPASLVAFCLAHLRCSSVVLAALSFLYTTSMVRLAPC